MSRRRCRSSCSACASFCSAIVRHCAHVNTVTSVTHEGAFIANGRELSLINTARSRDRCFVEVRGSFGRRSSRTKKRYLNEIQARRRGAFSSKAFRRVARRAGPARSSRRHPIGVRTACGTAFCSIRRPGAGHGGGSLPCGCFWIGGLRRTCRRLSRSSLRLEHAGVLRMGGGADNCCGHEMTSDFICLA
jgi:hypothetical protein